MLLIWSVQFDLAGLRDRRVCQLLARCDSNQMICKSQLIADGTKLLWAGHHRDQLNTFEREGAKGEQVKVVHYHLSAKRFLGCFVRVRFIATQESAACMPDVAPSLYVDD